MRIFGLSSDSEFESSEEGSSEEEEEEEEEEGSSEEVQEGEEGEEQVRCPVRQAGAVPAAELQAPRCWRRRWAGRARAAAAAAPA
jgi:hypothetical protein